MMNKKIVLPILFLGASVAVISCGKSDNPPVEQDKELVLTAAEKAKVSADNRFTLDMFLATTENLTDDENLFLSPFSIGAALSMTNNGAKGETQDNISEVLGLGELDEETVNSYYKKLIQDLPQLDAKTTLNIANSIWYKNDFSVLPEFLNANRMYFDAQTTALDFLASDAKDKINAWVNEKTKTKIPTIIDEIPESAVMYLMNAIYFKGQWDQQFDKELTEKQAFNKTDGSTVEADFMQVEHTFKVKSNENFDAIEIPYTKGKYSMVVVQPKENKTPRELVEGLLAENGLENLGNTLTATNTKLKLPKFKFTYENKLKEELIGLGMVVPFTDAADFSGITEDGGIKVSEVAHKAFVEVNEEGTEAAAVTSIGVELTSAGPSVYELTVDKPFLFFVKENSSGLVLFVGQVNDPLATETKAD